MGSTLRDSRQWLCVTQTVTWDTVDRLRAVVVTAADTIDRRRTTARTAGIRPQVVLRRLPIIFRRMFHADSMVRTLSCSIFG